MKKILIIVISAFMIIVCANFFYYRAQFNKQISNKTLYLDRQVKAAGLYIDTINNNFSNDISQILLTDDISCFFTDPGCRARTEDRMKLFFTQYDELVTGIKLYDNKRNEFSVKKDETGINWLEQNFVLHVQDKIITEEQLLQEGRSLSYYVPVMDNGSLFGNIVVDLDYQKLFSHLFRNSSLENYQWQWVLNDSGETIFNNSGWNLSYSGMRKILDGLEKRGSESLIHRADGGDKPMQIISSYYTTRLMLRDFCLVYSSPTNSFRKYILMNSIPLVFGMLAVILLLLRFMARIISARSKENVSLRSMERMLIRMVDEMPAGVVIYNGNREILRANGLAAEQYGYSGKEEMKGKIFPEPAVTDENNYFSKYLGGTFSPGQFVIHKKDNDDLILFRTSIPVTFREEEAIMDMLVDVTMLELARKQEASASSAKSDFLARMSYEIRTPLNGIIGMTDILEKQELTDEAKNIIGLLRRSGEVLLKIINDILDFSKIESGRMILDEIPFNLREEVVYCYDLARTNIDESRVQFSCNIEENVPDRVIGDPFRLRQILTNLLKHSADNTPDGKISLSCTLLENDVETLKLGFELNDTGKSFDNATIKKIFGDYVTIETKVLKDDDESGFGTILARQLVGLMGGEFTAVSPSGLDGGNGVKLSFSITLFSNDNPVKNLNFDFISSFGQIRTLVIAGSHTRDEEILGSLHKLGLALTVTTYQKSTVNQIRENLKHNGNRYHLLVILDDRTSDGFTVAREISAGGLAGEFAIVLISLNDAKGNLRKCIVSGVDHYIVKPYELKELYDKIKISFPQVDISAPVPENETVRRNLRILVVEDNKMNQKVIGTMLKSLGYSFDFADDGFAGYIQAKTRRYDVIFMDLIMPEMDGFESARKILEFDDTLLIVAFTADNLPESKRKAEMSGIKEFIPKPIRIDDLKKFFTSHFIRK